MKFISRRLKNKNHNKGLSVKKRLLKCRIIDPITGCWLWTLATIGGYGTISINHKSFYVHRIAYKEFVGEIKNSILHKTICPNRHCFNPDHLYDGDDFDNAQDRAFLNKTFNSNKTHCPQGHLYDKKNTLNEPGQRRCRICRSSQRALYYKNKKLQENLNARNN